MGKLKVIVIESGTGRSTPLIMNLQAREDIDLLFVKATMTMTKTQYLEAKIDYSDKNSNLYLGRSMSFPEIGCAHSHNIARSILGTADLGGVILEDDARICDIDNFVFLTQSFLKNAKNKLALLNLSNKSPLVDDCSLGHTTRPFYSRVLGPTPLAVGYAVTPRGALKLVENNSPISMVSDWPVDGISCYKPNHQLVHHGDGTLISTIDPKQNSHRNSKSTKLSLSILIGIYYISKRALDISFVIFMKRMWWPIVANKLRFAEGPRIYAKL